MRWRSAVLCATAALSALACALIFALPPFAPLGWRLALDPSSEPLLPAGDPARALYRQAIAEFGDDQLFVVAFETHDVFARSELELLRRVTRAISRLDGVRSVKSLADVVDFRWIPEQGWIDVGPFFEDVPADTDELAALRSRALHNPLYLRSLVSPDGRVAAINVSFHSMSDRELIERNLDGQIVSLLAAERRDGDGRHFYIAGRPHLKTHVYRMMLADLTRLIPASLAAIAATLALLTLSWRMVLLPLASVALATLWVFGLIAWMEHPLTLLTVLLAPTLLAIGSAYGVHVLFRYDEERVSGKASKPRLARAMRAMRAPVLISGGTTAAGFGALVWTDVPAVFELGAFSIAGVAFIVATTLGALPAALSFLPDRQQAERNAPRITAALHRGLEALAGMATRAPNIVLGFWLAVTIAAAAAIPGIAIDTDYLSFFPADAPVRRDFEAVNRLLAGATPLFVVFDGEGAGHFREPAALAAIEAAQRRIDSLPGVTHTASIVDPLKRLNRVFAEDDPAQEQLPDTRAGVAELMFSISKRDLATFSNVNQSRTNLVVRTGEVGSAAIRSLTRAIQDALASTELTEGTTARVTGNAILLARSADAIAGNQPRTVAAAALAIFVLISATLRSFRIGAIAMIPNVVPIVLFFGLLGLGAAPLSLPTSLIAAVALGLAIDATAHYIVRYRSERLGGLSPEAAVLRCNRYVGLPIATASLTLMVGFGVVGFSRFATLQHFGWLTTVTMGICLATDLLLLPALLVRFRV